MRFGLIINKQCRLFCSLTCLFICYFYCDSVKQSGKKKVSMCQWCQYKFDDAVVLGKNFLPSEKILCEKWYGNERWWGHGGYCTAEFFHTRLLTYESLDFGTIQNLCDKQKIMAISLVLKNLVQISWPKKILFFGQNFM